MNKNLLEQIKTLSNSKLGHVTVLETFARCLRSIYGKCSFLSFEQDPTSGQYLVRLKFKDADGMQQGQLDNLLGQAIPLRSQQLDQITTNSIPVIEMPDSELQSSLMEQDLPALSMMAIPLYQDGEISRWVLILGEEQNQFAEVELDEAILLANLAGTYIVRIDEAQALAKANAWIEKELDDIGRLQKLLLPQQEIAIKGVDTAVYFSSCNRAGGDYYDLVNLSESIPVTNSDTADAWGMIVADASGHGAAAAVEIAMLDAILRTYSGDGNQSAAGVFNYANKHFFTRMSRGSYITATIVGYSPETESIIYANAGHPSSLIISPDNELEYLNDNIGIPLGVDPNWQWQNAERKIKPGTVIISYTDGIVEAMSPERQQFGPQQLEQVVLQCSGSAQDYLDGIVKAIKAHQADYPQTDDQTILVIRINE